MKTGRNSDSSHIWTQYPTSVTTGSSPRFTRITTAGNCLLAQAAASCRRDMFPHLKDLKGRTLITSDGTTILGADDKAGIAEIMTMAERILDENIPHGPISIAFTPDEDDWHGCRSV